MLRLSFVSVACVVAFGPVTAGPAARARAEITRTVYFSAVDDKGVPVTDLAPAELALKENGRDRAITSLKPATGPIQVVLLVDDGGLGTLQPSVARFLTATHLRAEHTIALLSPQPMKLTNFASDIESLGTALSKIVQRGRVERDGLQLIEAISWASKALVQHKATRPAVVAITNGGEQPVSDYDDAILGDLRDSGASLNIVYIQGVPFGKVMTDGTRQSGGLLLGANSTQAVSDALTRIASNLTLQHVVTYTLPEGTKPSERFELKTTRKNVTLLAPTRISTK